MLRDTTVRTRIIDFLRSNGPVDDASGRATARLKDAVSYQGGDQGFSQVIGSMAAAGELTRDVRGKRTYRISASKMAEGAPVGGATLGGNALDYDELAAALLAKVTRVLTTSEAQGSSGASDQASWARRRIDQLETRLGNMQRDLARAKAEVEAVAEERDSLRGQLEAATHNLGLLTERMDTPRRPPSRAAERLDADDQALLYRLGGRPQQASPTRVG